MVAAKAVLKLLQHTMSVLTGKGLDFWIPQWARPSRDQFKGDRMMEAELTPVDDPSYGLLRVATRILFIAIYCAMKTLIEYVSGGGQV